MAGTRNVRTKPAYRGWKRVSCLCVPRPPPLYSTAPTFDVVPIKKGQKDEAWTWLHKPVLPPILEG